MPHLTTTASTRIHDSFKVEQVRGMFDLPREEKQVLHFAAEIPDLSEDWTIGAIVGPSGSGKTTIARAAFGEALHEPAIWPADEAIISVFASLPIKQVAQLLTAVGLGSPPAWLRPYHVLSGGEKFRCELARVLAEGWGLGLVGRQEQSSRLVVFDEYTSVVDRTVAKCASAAIGKLIRRWNKSVFHASSPSPSPSPRAGPCWV